MNILDKFKSLLFCFHTFGVRRTIDVLDSENQPGSGSDKILTGIGALGRTEDAWHLKYENKKEGFKNYLKYSFNRLLNSLCLRYEPRIRFLAKTGFSSLVKNWIFWLVWVVLDKLVKNHGSIGSGSLTLIEHTESGYLKIQRKIHYMAKQKLCIKFYLPNKLYSPNAIFYPEN